MQDVKATRVLSWLEERLSLQGATTDQMVQGDHQQQAETNVTVRNIITSMRLIAEVDWAEVFESVSLVDDALRRGSNFADLDFPTRNSYRSSIEELARGSKLTELEIARAVLAACGRPAGTGDFHDPREADPGFHLIAGGRRAFEKAIAFRPPLASLPHRLNEALGITGYAAIVLLLAAFLLAVPLVLMGAGAGMAAVAVLAVLGLIPAIDAAVPLVNRAIAREMDSLALPGLALRDGVPASLRTLVVMPTLLATVADVEEHVRRLEVHYLASQDQELYFALLSDWVDADAEAVEGDAQVFETAAAEIDRLNRQYGPGPAGARFHLLHRRRLWNPSQRKWMGWERKRGKIHELNRLLRGIGPTSFVNVHGQAPAPPPNVRYVITLDADTRMPPQTARRLIGKMAHPLNRPDFDAAARYVIDGHGLLQPRVTPSLPVGREASLLQRVFSRNGGIDPYAFTVSDVYQDLFDEGSYTGKGIYDVDAFEAALADRVPENTLLSHDLFEGVFVRSGLVSDIEVVEEFPAQYDAAVARQHRWTRGDWQLLPWILGRAGASGRTGAVPVVGRWKMLDNLRRSLSAPATVAALIAGWMLPLNVAVVWTAFLLAMLAIPPMLPALAAVLPRRRDFSVLGHARAFGREVGLAACEVALLVAFLAHQAWLMADAIARTLWRLATRRNLLEWVTAAQATRSARVELAAYYRFMWSSVAIGAAAPLAAWYAGGPWLIALPLAAAWMAAPAIAYRASRSRPVTGHAPVSDADARALRLVARRTWRYFERFVTAGDSMLPPDNFQETPREVVAHRTSPTNIGLYLLAAVSARDFGWTGTTDMAARLEATLETMGRMQRFRGHFYNWYDTQDLRPLEPRYVSSVDSGNLAGHLIALASACRERPAGPSAGDVALAGIGDAIAVASDLLQRAARRPADPDRYDRDAGRGTRIPAAGSCACGFRHGGHGEPFARAGAAGGNGGRYGGHARKRAGRRRRARASRVGGGRATRHRQPSSRLFTPASVRQRSEGSPGGNRERGAGDGQRHGLRLPVRQPSQAALDRLPRERRPARFELLRSPRLRSAARQLYRDRQGRRAGAALVSPRAGGHPDRSRRGADLLVGIHIRVPDALARHARAGRQPAGADQPAGRDTADRVRRKPRSAVGHLGIGVQRARP